MHFAETPAAYQQINHAIGGTFCGCDHVLGGFDDDPGIGSGVGSDCFAGLNQRPAVAVYARQSGGSRPGGIRRR